HRGSTVLSDIETHCEVPKLCFLFLFFFSSRRRHTRSKRDWSSDVCSSDLSALALLLVPALPTRLLTRSSRRSIAIWLTKKSTICVSSIRPRIRIAKILSRTEFAKEVLSLLWRN